jgi:type II secretory pathway component PulM
VAPETRSSLSEVERIREQVSRLIVRATTGGGEVARRVGPLEQRLRRRAKRQGLLLMAVSAVIMVVLIYVAFNAVIRTL